jgi:hypothetical protein
MSLRRLPGPANMFLLSENLLLLIRGITFRIKSLANSASSYKPVRGHFRESNLVIAADCTAFTMEIFTENT